MGSSIDHYLDLVLLPDPEFAPQQLMDALYAKLHRALVGLGAEGIGVSFPGLDESTCRLGNRLRLHGAAGDLDALMKTPWLTGMRDHLRVGEMAAVPMKRVLHRNVRRIQVDSSPERLRRRLMRRLPLDAAAAHERIPDSAAERLRLPGVNLRSRSTGQQFRLFVAHGPLQDDPVPGKFNAYGLSPRATVPWF